MFRSMLRRGALIVAAAGLAATGFGGSPAQAAGPFGAGEVAGSVRFTSARGVPAVGCNEGITFDFSSVVLNGTITDGNRVVAGAFNVSNVSGYSSTCAGATDFGVINDTATFSGGATGSGSGGFGGTYERVGSHTIVRLTATMTLCGSSGCASYSGVPINLDASEFVPTEIDPGTGDVRAASFTGEFHIGVGA